MKYTLTIGISAFNEAHNLKHLLPSLLAQKNRTYTLDRIIVYDDHSSDETKSLNDQFTKSPVSFIFGGSRKGKPTRINSIFEKSKSDIVCIIDADVKLANDSVLDNLVSTITSRSEHAIVSGYVLPFQPHSFVERIAYAGVSIWNIARDTVGPDSLYHCDGMIRAFTRGVYTHLRFPDHSAEDSYSYLTAKSQRWIFRSVRNALVYYRLPSTYHEYLSQQRRYLSSLDIERNHFGDTLIQNELTITPAIKFRALITYFFRDPVYTIFYLFSSVWVRVHLRIIPQSHESTWHILETTKRIHT